MRQVVFARCMIFFIVMFVAAAEFRSSNAQEGPDLPKKQEPTETLPAIPETPSTSDLPDSKGMERKLKELQLQKEETLRELQSQAESILRSWKSGQPKPETSTPSPPVVDESSSETSTDASSSETSTNQEPVPSTPVVKPEESGGAKPIPKSPPTQADATSDTAAPKVLVDGPIDRLALATSLYAIDQHPECLKVLNELSLSRVNSEDRNWAGYLKASCHRRLGNLPEAEKLYRELLRGDRSEWISRSAMWWLDHLSSMRQVEKECQTLKTTAKAWKEEIDELTQKP